MGGVAALLRGSLWSEVGSRDEVQFERQPTTAMAAKNRTNGGSRMRTVNFKVR
jgi:hypothetical protein